MTRPYAVAFKQQMIERPAVIGVDRPGKGEILESALKTLKALGLPGGGERITGEQVTAGMVGDGQGIAVALVSQHERALVVGADNRNRRASLGARRVRNAQYGHARYYGHAKYHGLWRGQTSSLSPYISAGLWINRHVDLLRVAWRRKSRRCLYVDDSHTRGVRIKLCRLQERIGSEHHRVDR